MRSDRSSVRPGGRNCGPVRRRWKCAGAEDSERPLRSCKDVVAQYLANYAANAKDEMRWFREPESIVRAIERACEGRIERNGRLVRHNHQCRISASVLDEAAARLTAQRSAVAAAPDFRGLHDLVETTIGPIAGIGELAIYDIAHRIGAHRGLAPDEVYVHRGTRKGAIALGFRGRKTIAMRELPAAFQRLTAAQAEDVLCIYHRDLARLRRLGKC